MEIVDIERLTRRQEAEAAGLFHSAFREFQDREDYRRWRRMGFPVAPYTGVYALEDGHVVSGVVVSHYPITTPDGPEVIAGIEAVATLPGAMREGYAGRLLDHVHEREAALGHRISMLWTSRSNIALGLYEKKGYRIIYSPESAFRRIPTRIRPKPTPYRIRAARARDAPAMERLHRRLTRGRFGFTPRFPGSFSTRFRLKFLPPESFLLAFRNGQLKGYCELRNFDRWYRSWELVASGPAIEVALLNRVFRKAAGKWLSLSRDWLQLAEPLKSKLLEGFLPLRGSYGVMMAVALAPELKDRDLAAWFQVGTPQFLCQAADGF